MEALIIPLFVAVFIAIAVMGHLARKKRREAFLALANKLDLTYSPGKNRDIASRYSYLKQLKQGSNRYAYNILSGSYQDHKIMVFDYHYETHSTDSKGHRRTTHHYFSFLMLFLGKSFPELTISNEGIFSKIAQAFGYDDIDFESHEFSRRFVVRSTDKKFAYDVCNAKMIDHLLGRSKISLEIDRDVLSLGYSSRLDPYEIENQLKHLLKIRSLMPNYLFEGV